MSPLSPARAALAGLLIASAATLGACGKTGELKRPGPLFGHAKGTPPAQQTQRQGEDPSNPIRTIDPRDMGRDSPVPAREDPIQGQSPDPTGVAPPTNMPDPYSHPTGQ
jgi:hypothetical protein